jgi:hypothetical protein
MRLNMESERIVNCFEHVLHFHICWRTVRPWTSAKRYPFFQDGCEQEGHLIRFHHFYVEMCKHSKGFKVNFLPSRELFIKALTSWGMPRTKKAVQTAPRRLKWGALALLCIFVVAAAAAYMPFPPTDMLVLALLGAYMALRNVQIGEETKFITAVVGLVLVDFVLAALVPDMLARFLTNLTVAFGAAGLLIALGLLVKLGSKY